MPGSPYKSKLTPYEAEITQLRQQRPRVPYREIVVWLHQRHGVVVSINALFSFLKIRRRWNRSQSGGSGTRAATAEKKTASVSIPLPPSGSRQAGTLSATIESRPDKPKPRFKYKPSDRYNLTRLTPEQIAALMNQIEEGD